MANDPSETGGDSAPATGSGDRVVNYDVQSDSARDQDAASAALEGVATCDDAHDPLNAVLLELRVRCHHLDPGP